MVTDQLLQEIEAGEGLTLTQAAKRLPRTRQGKPVTLGCVWRWVLNGVWLPGGGQRLRLEACRLAGKWITTPGAIRRFILGQTPNLDGERPLMPRSASARQRASERAAKELERQGV
jgi:hypothetical protein